MRTKGKWKIGTDGPYIVSGKQKICKIEWPVTVHPAGNIEIHEDEACENAEYICKSVNNHEKLVDGLKDCIKRMDRARSILHKDEHSQWLMLLSDSAKQLLKELE